MSFSEACNQKNRQVSLSVLLSYGTGLTIAIVRIAIWFDKPNLQSLNYAIKTHPMLFKISIHIVWISLILSQLPEDGETTPTNPRFNPPGSRMIRGFPSPSSSSAMPPSSSTRLGGDPSSLASSSSSEQTMSESSTSSAYEQQVSRPLFPPGPLSTRSSPSTPDRTGLARPSSGSNLLNQNPAGRGQKGAKVSALLSKSNPGRGAREIKPANLQFKNEGSARLSSHPLLSPQSNSKFRLPNTPGSSFLQAGGGRSGGNSISKLLEKRGSPNSSGGSSTSSSRQTSLEFPVSLGSAKNSNWRKRSNTEPISPFMKEGGSKGPLKIQSFSSGIGELTVCTSVTCTHIHMYT